MEHRVLRQGAALVVSRHRSDPNDNVAAFISATFVQIMKQEFTRAHEILEKIAYDEKGRPRGDFFTSRELSAAEVHLAKIPGGKLFNHRRKIGDEVRLADTHVNA